MKRGLGRHGINRTDGDRPPTGEAERVAVWQIERYLGDVERCQRTGPVPLRDARCWYLLPLSLRVDKPVRLESEARERLGILGAVIPRDRALEREGHPEPQRTLSALDVSPLAFPGLVGRQRSQRQATLCTLHRSEHLVTEAE